MLTTEIFLRYRREFLHLLQQELQGLNLEAEAAGTQIAVRLNGTSDLDFFPMIQKETGFNVLEEYKSLIYYDYTKSIKKWRLYKDNPRYSLTFSKSESNWPLCQEVLQAGGNVAIVFERIIPDLYEGFETFDGDLSDMRWADPAGKIIGLSYKKVSDVSKDNLFIVKS